jgi:hypothetical protein
MVASLPQGPIMSQFHTLTFYFFMIYFQIAHAIKGFWLKLCILIFPKCTTWLTDILNLVTLIIFGIQYKLWHSSLCSFLDPPILIPYHQMQYHLQHHDFKESHSNFLIRIRHIISYPSKTKVKLQFHIFQSLERRQLDKRFWIQW